jgi:hypothetical protein
VSRSAPPTHRPPRVDIPAEPTNLGACGLVAAQTPLRRSCVTPGGIPFIGGMRGRKLAIALLVAWLLFIVLTQGGSKKTVQRLSRMDGWGDLFVSDAQMAAIRLGMSQREVFRMLGGQGSSGYYYTDSVASPTRTILTYDYPIRHTGNPGPDTTLDDGIVWWRICVRGRSVVGKRRIRPRDGYPGC